MLEVVGSGRMRVSNLFIGAIEGRPIFTVDVPVLNDGTVIYVLRMVVEPERILQVLRSQGLNEHWIAAVFDRDGVTIARTRDSEASVGTKAGAGLLRAVSEGRSGTYENVIRDGTPVIGTFRRLDMSQWFLAIAVPRERLDAQRNRFLALLGGGGVLILAAAAGLTLQLARQLARRLGEVGEMAGKLGMGQPVQPSATGIRELDAVVDSLSCAATLIASRERDLSLARKAAEEALASKAKFFAAANHDLRQPVQSLFLFHSALQATFPVDHPASRMLLHVERSLRALERLLSGLLDVSRLDADAITPVIRGIAMDELLAPLAEEYRLRAAESGIQLRLVPCREAVRSDPAVLERVVRNLLENAIRYTPSGGRILLGCRRRGGGVRLDVVDTGIGIPIDQQEAIFDEFHQVGNPSRDSTMGLGLGLAIVRRACQLLGHEVSVASVLGKGSRFSVMLPGPPRPG
ncbi:MAG: sensor histidine kinase [Magnetospirillum sp.]|nr:sensor histidine kinase [Magnetospirillum sp.]